MESSEKCGSSCVAAPTPSSSPPTLTPSLSDGNAPYWIDLSQLIDSVAINTTTAAACDDPKMSSVTVYTRHALQGILLFCGIKQHRVQQTVSHMIAQLLPAAFAPVTSTTPTAAPSLLRLSGGGDQANVPAEPTSLPLLVKDWLTLSLATPSADGAPADGHYHSPHSPHHFPRRYQLHVPAAMLERTVIKVLGSELRGQMICLRPLLRWNLACAQQSGRAPVVILIGGTSGTGKSTLARLVASQERIANVLSTDTVRQVLRARLAGREPDYPTLFASTYEAYKTTGHTAADVRPQDVVAAYESQCELVLQVLDGILHRLLARRESVVVEGVHLLPRYLTAKRAALLVDHVTCVPVLVRIPKADGHLERFCVRARGMSLQPSNNKYIASFNAIRAIQSHLVAAIEEAAIPVLLLSNTNVDKSFLVLHHAVLETMEHTALHGWPADLAATAQVPLTPPAFAATKQRLVAVVRQRRAYCGVTTDVVPRGGREGRLSGGAAAAGDGQSRHYSTTTTKNTVGQTAANAGSVTDRFELAAASGTGTAFFPAVTSRARSADLLSTNYLRHPAEQSLFSSFREGSAVNAHADPVDTPQQVPLAGVQKARTHCTHGAFSSCLSPSATSSSAVISERSGQPPSSHLTAVTTMSVAKRNSPSAVADVGEVGNTFSATVPRRSTTTSILQPSFLGALLRSRGDEEEAFDEPELPSLMGS